MKIDTSAGIDFFLRKYLFQCLVGDIREYCNVLQFAYRHVFTEKNRLLKEESAYWSQLSGEAENISGGGYEPCL